MSYFSKYKFDKSKFRLGMRTMKTGIAVFIVLLIFGMFGWEVTVISSNYIALQLIITISTVIHLVVSYREFYAKHPKYSQNQLIYLTLRDKFSPSFWAIFTTVIGFSSLMSADIKPVIMLGIMMSAGISVSLVLAFLLFGAINVNLKKKFKFSTRVIISTVLGFAVGIVFQSTLGMVGAEQVPDVIKNVTTAASLVGRGFTSLLKMVVIPLVGLSVYNSIINSKTFSQWNT